MNNYLVKYAVLDLQVGYCNRYCNRFAPKFDSCQASQRVINRKFGNQILSQWRQCKCCSNCELPRKRLEEFSLFPRHLRCNRLWTETETRQAMGVKRNVQARPCNHCCSGKAMSITYSECVCIAVGTQRAMRLRSVVICGLSGSTAFFHIFS